MVDHRAGPGVHSSLPRRDRGFGLLRGWPGHTPGSLATAAVVFVGNVVSTTNGGREATVKVESIWRGPSLLTYARVIGTPDRAAQATSVGRTYEVGRRYLFVPQNSSPPFQDNNCSATQPYTSALASQAPADTCRLSPVEIRARPLGSASFGGSAPV